MRHHAGSMLWYTRRDDVIRGPFSNDEMTRNLILGRLCVDDEVSLDKCRWQSAEQCKALMPAELQQICSWDDYQCYVIIRTQLDERRVERRILKGDHHPQRRSGKERRQPYSDQLISHYLFGALHKTSRVNRNHEKIRPLLLTLLMVSILLAWLVSTQR